MVREDVFLLVDVDAFLAVSVNASLLVRVDVFLLDSAGAPHLVSVDVSPLEVLAPWRLEHRPLIMVTTAMLQATNI